MIRITQRFKSAAFFLAIVTLLLLASGLFEQIAWNIDKQRIVIVGFVIGSGLDYLFTSKFVFQAIYKF